MWTDLKSKLFTLWGEKGFSRLAAWAEWRLVLRGGQDVLVPSHVGGGSLAYSSEVLLLEGCKTANIVG